MREVEAYITAFPVAGAVRRVPWQLATRFSRKSALTTLGIALGVAFALVSFSMAAALERETLGVAENHSARGALVLPRDDARLLWSDVADLPGIVGVRTGEGADPHGRPLHLVAFYGAAELQAAEREARAAPGQAVVVRVGDEILAPGPPVAHRFLASGWIVVNPLSLGGGELIDYAILMDPTPATLQRVTERGLDIAAVPALGPFFEASGKEIARDLLLVVAFASALAGLFCYEFMRGEVRESRHEIGIWRALGMRGGDVLRLFLARAAILGIAALALGWTLSALILGLAFERTGSSLLRFALDSRQAISLCAVFVVAALAGGAVPAYAASRITIQRSLESDP